MKKLVSGSLLTLLFVFVSYNTASSQVVDKVKDAAKKTTEVTKDVADKTKDATVDAAKKTGGVTKDVADKTGDVVVDGTGKAAGATKDAAKVGASKTKKFGNSAVNVTENVAGEAYEGGKYFTVTTWDGAKWVSKRVWYNTKKAADVTRDAVTGKSSEKP